MSAPAPIERPNRLPIYLDNQSTTPLDPRVLEAMLPYFTEHFGNPHSESHVYGKNAAAAIEAARADLARLIGADPREIVFTSGATEANNLALKGAAHFARAYPPAGREPRDQIITLTTEHKCVLESAAALAGEGFAVSYLPVHPTALLALGRLADPALRRPRNGRLARRRRDGRGGGARPHAARPAAETPDGPDRRAAHQWRPRASPAGKSEPVLPGPDRAAADRRRSQHR